MGRIPERFQNCIDMDGALAAQGREPRFVEDTFIDVGELLGMAKGELRGAGHTTHQMRSAPRDAIYVWCNGDTGYPKHLARHLGREDLEIVSSHWVMKETNYWHTRGPIVLDHALFGPSAYPDVEFKPHKV